MIEFEKKYEAPALARGLGLLKIMQNKEEYSLEKLAEFTNTPKSSLLRLLDTLQQLDYVQKSETTKKYSSTKVLIEISELNQTDTNLNLTRIMESSCDKLSRTVEWYIPTEAGMTLVERCIPQDQEVQVRVKIGYIRKWGIGTELEAVSSLGYAFGNIKEGVPSELIRGSDKREQIVLSSDDIMVQINSARANKFVYDKHYNSNGIRRAAIPILKNQRLVGILAVAEHKSINHPIKGKEVILALQKEINNQ